MVNKKGLSSRQMSSLYKKTKKKLGAKKAFKYVGQKKKESKWQAMGTIKRAKLRRKLKDSDKDGVPNRYDCEPYNKYRQDKIQGEGFVMGNEEDFLNQLTSEERKNRRLRKIRNSDDYIYMVNANEKLKDYEKE